MLQDLARVTIVSCELIKSDSAHCVIYNGLNNHIFDLEVRFELPWVTIIDEKL